MAIFNAYFDASGSERTRVIAVAGFVSRVEKWERLEDEWKELLPDTVHMFHMTDFVSGRDGWESWRGPDNSERRAKFIQSLVACIKRNTNQGFSASLRSAQYREVNHEYTLKELFGGPYSFLGISCLGRLKKWADKRRIDVGKILCIFEDGDHGQGDFISLARKDGYNAIPQSKANIRAFDACDLAAWKSKSIIDDAWERQLHLESSNAADKIMQAVKQIETVIRG